MESEELVKMFLTKLEFLILKVPDFYKATKVVADLIS